MKLSISVVGTGRMGSALARALLRSGYRTTVWNRTKQKAEPLAALGATVAGSVLEAVKAAEIIIVNVSDYQATAAVLHDDAVASALRGKLVVELTSGTPHGAREAAEWFAEHGASYLDGAIMATPDFIGQMPGRSDLGAKAGFRRERGDVSCLGRQCPGYRGRAGTCERS